MKSLTSREVGVFSLTSLSTVKREDQSKISTCQKMKKIFLLRHGDEDFKENNITFRLVLKL